MPELKKTILEAIQAILPVTLAVVVLQLVFVKMPTPLFLQFLISAFMAAVGMSLFFRGQYRAFTYGRSHWE